MVGGEATVPRHLCKIGPWYEAIIYFTYCKLSKLEIGGLGIRLQSRSTGLVPKLSEIWSNFGGLCPHCWVPISWCLLGFSVHKLLHTRKGRLERLPYTTNTFLNVNSFQGVHALVTNKEDIKSVNYYIPLLYVTIAIAGIYICVVWLVDTCKALRLCTTLF